MLVAPGITGSQKVHWNEREVHWIIKNILFSLEIELVLAYGSHLVMEGIKSGF